MSASPSPLGRNDRCHCGSGKKYKQCCLDKDEQALRAQRAEATASPAAEGTDASRAASTEGHGEPPTTKPRHAHQKLQQPWMRSPRGMQGFQRASAPRKVGGGG